MVQKTNDAPKLFHDMLQWLHAEPEKAGLKYEQIRRRLIFILKCRGCTFADDLADECIDRVAKIVSVESFTYSGDQALLFYGVARIMIKEYFRSRVRDQHIPDSAPDEDKERDYECLEKCMGELSDRSRGMILDYYGDTGGSKNAHRKWLADRLGIPLNALRIQTCRVRTVLRSCVLQCVESKDN